MLTTTFSVSSRNLYTISIKVLFALGIVLFSSCKSPTSPTEPPNKVVFTLGTKSTVGTQAISGSGGTLTISGTQTKLDGLTLTVSPFAYTGSKTFAVSYSPITSSTLSADLVALTPMITISNGGGYADSVIMLKIPVTIPTGSFAGAFFYNESTGELEPISLAEETSTSITVATRHFSTSNITSGAMSGKGPHPEDLSSYSDIVILAMDETKLFALGSVTTQFKPGTDDWEFTNFGSYIATGGICAGQSMTAMWYYYQQKGIENHGLFGYLDPNANVQNDDRLGYRFASVVHRDLANWDVNLTSKKFQGLNPPLTFKMFLLSMYVTKQPQMVSMLETANLGGHAMVCYGVQVTDKLNGKLLVEDPNHPGQANEIKYVNGVLGPYPAGLRADGTPESFDVIALGGKSALINWTQIATRWAQLKAKTIGNVAPNAFPQYTLQYYDPDASAYVNMPSNFTLNSDSLQITLTVPGSIDKGQKVYSSNGTRIQMQNGKYPLSYGMNIIGFYVAATPPGDNANEWVDFVWDTIYSNQLAIQPATMNGQKNTSYNWSASAGSIPSNARYEWDFGDQTAKVTKINDGAASHTYATDGLYTITLTLFDNSNNTKLGQTTATATIGGLWNLLHQQNVLQASFASTFNYSDGRQDPTSWEFPANNNVAPLTWKDTTFSATIYKETYRNGNSFDSESCVIKGTMQADGLTIKSMTVFSRIVNAVYAIAGNLIYKHEYEKSFTVTNAVGVDNNIGRPAPPIYPPTFYWMTGVDKLVSNVRDDYTSTDFDPTTGKTTVTTRHLTSITWNSSTQPDILNVLIYKQ